MGDGPGRARTLNRQAALLSVRVTGADEGWVTGQVGYVARFKLHEDGRFDWAAVTTITSASLRRIVMYGNDWWAIGANDVILFRHGDGPWEYRHGTEPPRGTFSHIVWTSERDGWIASSGGALMRTRNGGAIWTPVEMPWPTDILARNRVLNSVTFAGKTGWAVGNIGAIFATTDGGTTWSLQNSQVQRDLLSVVAVSGQAAWAVGQAGTILQTTDGSRWIQVFTEKRVTFTSAFFSDETHGWIVGHGGVILSTSDGSGWRLRDKTVNSRLHDVTFLDSTHGWVVGSEGTVLSTEDGGEHWRKINVLDTKTSFNGVHFTTSQNGWVVGDDGNLLATIDGGKSWQRRRMPPGLRLTDVSFLNPDFGWVVGKGVIATMARRSLPSLLSLDAKSTAGGVELVGTVSSSVLESKITRLEYAAAGTGQYTPLPLPAPLRLDNGNFRYQWAPAHDGFKDGTGFTYRVAISDGVNENAKAVDATFVYKNWFGKLMEDDPWLIPGLIIVVIFAFSLLIPAWLFRVYAWLPWKAMSEAAGNGTIAVTVRGIATVIFNPFVFRFGWVVRAWAKRYTARRVNLSDLHPDLRADYLRRSEVLTAWVARRAERATRQHERVMEQISAQAVYIPMPLFLDSVRIENPNADLFSWLFVDGPVAVTVWGRGGSGKSTFAVQLGSWALAGVPSAPHALIPVYIKHPTTNLLTTVRQALNELEGDDDDGEIDEVLIRSLIRNKRLLLIINSYSEWPEEAQR